MAHAKIEGNHLTLNRSDRSQNTIKFAFVAILPPAQFDNYQFWKLMEQKAPEDIENIQRAVNKSGLDHELDNISYPSFEKLIFNLQYHCISLIVVLNIMKSCAIKGHEDKAVIDYIDAKLNHSESSENVVNPHADFFREADNPLVLYRYLGKPEPRTSATIALQVLSGFMMALGAAVLVIALAFVALNPPLLGTVGLIGGGVSLLTSLAGMGLFAYTSRKHFSAPWPIDNTASLDCINNSTILT